MHTQRLSSENKTTKFMLQYVPECLLAKWLWCSTKYCNFISFGSQLNIQSHCYAVMV